MKVGDLVRHWYDKHLGLVIDHDLGVSGDYKVKWLGYINRTGWYSPDRLEVINESR